MRSIWKCSNDHVGVHREPVDNLGTDMPKPARNSMTSYGRPDCLADDQSETWPMNGGCDVLLVTRNCVYDQVRSTHSASSTHHHGEVTCAMQPIRLRKHPELQASDERLSGCEFFAALAATCGNDCTTRTGTHTKTEAMNARAAAIVRLERPLALGHGQHSSRFEDADLSAPAVKVLSEFG